jgi:hypothetical protein
MSASYRTTKTWIAAARRFPRDREGNGILPRVIEREPRIGDVHPLRKQHIVAFLHKLPIDYLYGLKRIELRPRPSDEIGKPYGCYLVDEKIIILYSVPALQWQVSDKGAWLFELHGAEIEAKQDAVFVHWKKPVDLAYFMYREVFLHELGHHYDNQYRNKRKWPQTVSAHESSANRRAFNLAKREAFALWHDFQKPPRKK